MLVYYHNIANFHVFQGPLTIYKHLLTSINKSWNVHKSVDIKVLFFKRNLCEPDKKVYLFLYYAEYFLFFSNGWKRIHILSLFVEHLLLGFKSEDLQLKELAMEHMNTLSKVSRCLVTLKVNQKYDIQCIHSFFYSSIVGIICFLI